MTSTLTKISVANAPCSWGALEFDLHARFLGYEQVLDQMAASGYAGTELGDWGFMPTQSDKLRAAIQSRKLQMLGAFVPVNLSDADAHAEGVQRAVRTAQLLASVSGTSVIVLSDDNCRNEMRRLNAGRIRAEHSMSDSQWKAFIQGSHKVAREVLRTTGLRTVFHHHCAGYVETPREIERFLSSTDPDLIGLCFDTGHYQYGGGNALEGLMRHADRIKHVHYKDCSSRVLALSRNNEWDYFRSVQNGIFCELGKGIVPFAEITSELKRSNYQGWIVVEQDVLPGMGTPFESAVRNRKFLSAIGL